MWMLRKIQQEVYFDCCCIDILLLSFTFMQGIYDYIPETKHVSRVYNIAAALYLQFVLHVMLFRP